MKQFTTFLLLFFCGLSVLQAQQYRERWDASDYFPKDHFVIVYNNGEVDSTTYADRAGEVAFYMRLAGMMPWQDTSREEALTMIRISMLPEYSHPIFIRAVITDDSSCVVDIRRGNAICGYVEHSLYLETTDSGLRDITEERYHGNRWVEGIIEENGEYNEVWLTKEQLDSLNLLIKETDLPHYRHTTSCTGFMPPYVIEYSHDKTYNAVYDECYDEPPGTLVNYLVALADTSYIDMVIHYPNKRNGIVPAQFPGGSDSCQQFITNNMRYPERALADREEYSVSINFVVERDGSLTRTDDYDFRSDDDIYGFYDEAIRLFDLMPRWQPAMDNGRPVRSHATCQVRFNLPDSLQPIYGNPHLETGRDSIRWNNIFTYHRRLLREPQNQEYSFRMGIFYYDEFLLDKKEVKAPDYWDTLQHDEFGESWESILDRTPVVAGAADSALCYFYRALSATDSVNQEKYINMYLPIRQLEQYLGLPHNPLNKLPYDTVQGAYYPYSYFTDMSLDGELDSTVDYYIDASLSDSYFWVKVMSEHLKEMSEPVLYDTVLAPGDVVYRCAFYPSFHPPLSFRIENTAQGTMLYWKQLDFIVDTATLNFTLIPREGQSKLNKRKYRKFLKLWNNMQFDERPRISYRPMIDGAQWCLERRTADSFKAWFTNMAGKKHDQLYSYLIRLASIKADYASDYCH